MVLKRLDDSNDKVRSCAVQTLCKLFSCRPQYDTVVYSAHIDALYSALLVHLDDNDEIFQKEILGKTQYKNIVFKIFYKTKV